MKKTLLLLACFAIAACDSRPPGSIPLSKEPLSVRGWVADAEGGAPAGSVKTIETETARLAELFQNTSIWVENAQYVSGGIAGDGAFLLLDVPPGNVALEFSTPQIKSARVVMTNIPGNADVFIPAILLKKDGSVALLQPNDVRIRIPARVEREQPSGLTATVAGVRVPVMRTPIASMVDRHDYPVPGGIHPVATFK